MATESRRRGPIYAEYRPPAPIYQKKTTVGATDHCLTFDRAPSFSIGEKYNARRPEGPGPSYMYDPNVTAKGKQAAPSFTLSGRPRTKGVEVLPGPGAYNPETVREGSLSHERRIGGITMAPRTTWPFKSQAPAPNSYRPRTGIGAGAVTERMPPTYSLRGRSDVGGAQYAAIKANNPGPGSYGATDPTVFKPASGTFTLQGRTKVKDYTSTRANPGPGAYDLKLPNGKRGFSMGIRHSDYVMPLIRDIDII